MARNDGAGTGVNSHNAARILAGGSLYRSVNAFLRWIPGKRTCCEVDYTQSIVRGDGCEFERCRCSSAWRGIDDFDAHRASIRHFCRFYPQGNITHRVKGKCPWSSVYQQLRNVPQKTGTMDCEKKRWSARCNDRWRE